MIKYDTEIENDQDEAVELVDEQEDEESEGSISDDYDARALDSWTGKIVKDIVTEEFGRVYGHTTVDGQPRLEARFPFPGEESELRIIALQVTPGGDYLDPTDSRARYRALSAADKQLLVAKLRSIAR